MFDSPITLLLLGISAASALASYSAARRWRRARSAPPALASLSDQELATVLATLQSNEAPDTAQRTAQPEIHRRITLLVIEEIERRRPLFR